MSFLPSPASASAPWAHSACSWNNDLSSALRVGCSKIPTILALPLMLIGGFSSHGRLVRGYVPNRIPSGGRGQSRLRTRVLLNRPTNVYLGQLDQTAAEPRMNETKDISEAKTPLSQLVDQTAKGKETTPREPDNLLGVTFIAEDFAEPLPPDIQSALEAGA